MKPLTKIIISIKYKNEAIYFTLVSSKILKLFNSCNTIFDVTKHTITY